MLGNNKRYTFFYKQKLYSGLKMVMTITNGHDNHCIDDYGGDRIKSRNPTSRMPIKVMMMMMMMVVVSVEMVILMIMMVIVMNTNCPDIDWSSILGVPD